MSQPQPHPRKVEVPGEPEPLMPPREVWADLLGELARIRAASKVDDRDPPARTEN